MSSAFIANRGTACLFYILLFSILLLCGITLQSCSHAADADGSHQASLNYAWSVDTIPYTQGGMPVITSMWGVNGSLIYAVGWDQQFHGIVWKYDGRVWTDEKLFTNEGGKMPLPMGLYAITGVNASDVYAFGETVIFNSASIDPQVATYRTSPFGLHYDGVQWSTVSLPAGGGIYSAYSASPGTIVCAGFNGAFYKMTGGTWTLDTICRSAIKDGPVMTKIIGLTPTNGINLGTHQSDSQTGAEYYTMLTYENNTVTVLDSAKNTPSWGGIAYWQSPTGTLYATGYKGIYRSIGGTWSHVLTADAVQFITGIDDEHLFAASFQGIYFSDGNSWDLVWPTTTEMVQPTAMWCTRDQVFVAYGYYPKGFVVHGKKQ